MRRLLFPLLLLLAICTLKTQVQFSFHEFFYPVSGESIISATDINGDGTDDILIAYINEQKISYLTSAGSSAYESEIVIAVEIVVSELLSADLDNDGDIDLVYISGNKKELGYFINDGSGNFTQQVLQINTDYFLQDLIVSDFNNDNVSDIALINTLGSNRQLISFTNEGAGEFSDAVVNPVNATSAQLHFPSDVDGDNDIDIIAHISGLDQLAVFENNGEGKFVVRNIVASVSQNIHSIVQTDFNNDGIADLAVASNNEVNSNNQTKVSVFASDGFGHYSLVYSDDIAAESLPQEVRIVNQDIDGDGDEDILLQFESYSSTLSFLKYIRNDRQFNFGISENLLVPIISAGVINESLCFIDIDSDVDPDIIYSDNDGLYVYENMPGTPEALFEFDECRNIINNTSLAYYPQSTFSWDFGNGETSTDPNPLWPFDTTGSYEIELTVCAGDDCSTRLHPISVSHVLDYNIPNIGNIYSENHFTDNSIGYTNWSWIIGDEFIDTNQSTSYAFSQKGTYEIEFYLTDANQLDCTAVIREEIFINSEVAAEEKPAKRSLVIIPNPAQDYCIIKAPDADEWHGQLMNDKVRTLIQDRFEGNQLELDLSNLQNGLYFFISTNPMGEIIREKILIKR